MIKISKMDLGYFIDYYFIEELLNNSELKTIEFTGKYIENNNKKILITKEKKEILKVINSDKLVFGESMLIINIENKTNQGLISFLCKKEGLELIFKSLY